MKLKLVAGLLALGAVASTSLPAEAYTIPSVSMSGGAGSGLSGPGTVGPNADGVQGNPGVGFGGRTIEGLSSTTGLTGAADGGIGGTTGGFTGTTGGFAGAPGGMAAGRPG